MGKLIYTVNSWWGFTSVADRQCLEAVVRRTGLSVLQTHTHSDTSIKRSDIIDESYPTRPHPFLADQRELVNSLRKRKITRLLTVKQLGHLYTCNFISWMLYIVCYQSALLVRLYCIFTVTWSHRLNTSKIIPSLVSPGCSLFADPNIADIIKREHPRFFAGIGVGAENSGFRRTKAPISLKHGKTGPKLLSRTNRKSHARFRLVTKSTTSDDL